MRRFLWVILVCFSVISRAENEACNELVCASEYGNASGVRTLLVDGVDSFCHLTNGVTPLMAATTNMREGGKIIEALLNVGVDVNARDKQGRTALMYAAQQGRFDYFSRLLSAGANIHARDNDGLTVLMYVCMRYSWELHDSHCAQAEQKHTLGGSAYRVQIVQRLHALGADFDAVDKFGRTALMVAVLNNWPCIVDKLIELGADVNHTDEAGRTPLICEAQKRLGKGTFEDFLSDKHLSTHIFESLLRANADFYLADNAGNTAIKILMYVQDSAAMKVFLYYERLQNTAKYFSLFAKLTLATMGAIGTFVAYHLRGRIYAYIKNIAPQRNPHQL